MIKERLHEGLYKQLMNRGHLEVMLHGAEISLRSINDETFSFSTPVYYGGNYIPHSVRNCLTQPAPFIVPYLKTNLKIDEDNFSIHLICRESLETLNPLSFMTHLEEFAWQAEQWRFLLDRHDRDDRVYIKAS